MTKSILQNVPKAIRLEWLASVSIAKTKPLSVRTKNVNVVLVTSFASNLKYKAYKKPFLPIQTLEGIGAGVIELKINGSPAFRCVYIAKFPDSVVVLHSFEKTTNGVDRQAMKTVEKRYKELKAEIEKMKRQK